MVGISVVRVLMVQGKQFRAIFQSTLRTRRTCTAAAALRKAWALCSIGRCRKVWEQFIEIYYQNKSLFAITWSLLKSQLDGVELKKTYVLNPSRRNLFHVPCKPRRTCGNRRQT